MLAGSQHCFALAPTCSWATRPLQDAALVRVWERGLPTWRHGAELERTLRVWPSPVGQHCVSPQGGGIVQPCTAAGCRQWEGGSGEHLTLSDGPRMFSCCDGAARPRTAVSRSCVGSSHRTKGLRCGHRAAQPGTTVLCGHGASQHHQSCTARRGRGKLHYSMWLDCVI